MTDIDWNNAIEAAAVVADDYGRRAWAAQPAAQQAAVAAGHIAGEIRKLKVDVSGSTPPIVGAAGDEALCTPTDKRRT
ncbi:MAG TPA: hypothetical protein VKF35_10700 [Hyphomicrobiaceae bacterium]|nr:hypothetical protein [Hyphomicrobiaceae bacterium]